MVAQRITDTERLKWVFFLKLTKEPLYFFLRMLHAFILLMSGCCNLVWNNWPHRWAVIIRSCFLYRSYSSTSSQDKVICTVETERNFYVGQILRCASMENIFWSVRLQNYCAKILFTTSRMRTCFNSHQMSVPVGCPQVNKFEQFWWPTDVTIRGRGFCAVKSCQVRGRGWDQGQTLLKTSGSRNFWISNTSFLKERYTFT